MIFVSDLIKNGFEECKVAVIHANKIVTKPSGAKLLVNKEFSQKIVIFSSEKRSAYKEKDVLEKDGSLRIVNKYQYASHFKIGDRVFIGCSVLDHSTFKIGKLEEFNFSSLSNGYRLEAVLSLDDKKSIIIPIIYSGYKEVMYKLSPSPYKEIKPGDKISIGGGRIISILQFIEMENGECAILSEYNRGIILGKDTEYTIVSRNNVFTRIDDSAFATVIF